MDAWFGTMRRLYSRGPDCRGLAGDAEGVALGPSCVLVRRTADGYHCARPEEVAGLLRFVFDDREGAQHFWARLDNIARALNVGELAKAQLLGLQIPLGELDDRHLERLALASSLIKAGYDPDEPRDAHGRWTTGGAGAASAAGTVAAAEVAGASVFGAVGRAALAGLVELGAGMTAAAAFLGVLFIPTNRSNVSGGQLLDRPDIAYRYDEGVLTLYQDDGDGNRRVFFSGVPDDDGLYRDAGGQVIGRDLGTSVMIDPDALPGQAASAGASQRSAAGTAAQARADAGTDEPKLCPDPGPDAPRGKSDRAITYQQQITGLPPGLAVKLTDPSTGKEVYFDGCRENDGTMLEAKGAGYLDMLQKKGELPWKAVVDQLVKQANRQWAAARGRPIEWHFAERGVADYVRGLFSENGLKIVVIYTPPLRS